MLAWLVGGKRTSRLLPDRVLCDCGGRRQTSVTEIQPGPLLHSTAAATVFQVRNCPPVLLD
ncbi:hypothetical protein SORBI_3006G075650 [Sorghum bicolor]|uniref:Uncharacterized protein n=1 Tax=Sorghum bicolor TaxID=4558 RepID=A0A1Z5RCV1_SORBI|nr:hypothetical protein SORBI_3006G075650 [Sorghum bicolor]